jgi:N-methylhydantoinase A
VANANMMRAVKGVTTYRGRDPRDFALYAFGGNGGVHGVELARSLQIPMVIVPPAAGVFSAIGLLTANVELTLAQGMLSRMREMDVDKVEQTFQALENQIAGQLGHRRATIAFARAIDLRYTGQAFELTIEAPGGKLDPAACEELERKFEQEHERTYGHAFRGTYAIEAVTLRVTGSVATGTVHSGIRAQATYRPSGTRSVYFGRAIGERETPIIARDQLGATLRAGPFIVEEYEGTTVVPPDCAARLDTFGNIVIEVGRQA